MHTIVHRLNALATSVRSAMLVLLAGVLAGGSVGALGIKAIVIIPAIVMAGILAAIPFSPLYMIVATLPINVELVGPITVARLAIVFGLFVAFLQGLKGMAPRLHIPMPEGVLAMIFFGLVCFGTVVVSHGQYITRLGIYIVYAAIFFIVLIYVDTPRRFRNVLLTLMGIGLIQSALIGAEMLFGLAPFGGVQAEIAADRGIDEVRVVGISAHPIVLATFFLFVLAASFFFFCITRNGVQRLLLAMTSVVFLVSWVLAWSRSSWIGMAVMLGIAMLLWRPTRLFAIIGGSIAFVLLYTHDFSPSAVIRTIDSIAFVQSGSFRAGVAEGSESFGWRTENWYAAFAMWADNPVFGLGVDRTHAFMLDYMPPGATGHRFIAPAVPHNMFLQVLAESGLPALVLFVLLWLTAFAGVRQAWMYDDLRPYAIFILIVMCGQLTTYFFNPVPRDIWLSMGLAMALGRMARVRQTTPHVLPPHSPLSTGPQSTDSCLGRSKL